MELGPNVFLEEESGGSVRSDYILFMNQRTFLVTLCRELPLSYLDFCCCSFPVPGF